VSTGADGTAAVGSSAMDERARRVGLNEAVFREVNERIRDVNHGIAELGDGRIHVVCECGELSCHDQIGIEPAAYEEIRRNDRRFVVVPGHEVPDVETVVAVGDGWIAVEKHEGEPARLAAETSPRS